MIVFDITGTEDHIVYQNLEIENGTRQYDFLRSIVNAARGLLNNNYISHQIILALNYHAITCLHKNAGEYRPCAVVVGNGPEAYYPPPHEQVHGLMSQFIGDVNKYWGDSDPVTLASYALWKINHIHPFVNGNGRTARAVCYFILCIKSGGWLSGNTILPELIKRDRVDYVIALKEVDRSFNNTGTPNLKPLHDIITKLLGEQLRTV